MDSKTKSAFIYAMIVAMGAFLFGLDAALISGGVELFKKEFSLDAWQVGWVVSAPALGVIPALPFFAWICNGLGRKKAILLISVLYLISAVGSALAPNFWTLTVSRFIGGVSWSSISIASMYIGEIAPSKWRGKLVTMVQINIVIGLFGAYFVTYLIHYLIGADIGWVQSLGATPQNEWRWMLGAEIPVCVLWMLMVAFIPESPYWLLYAGRNEEAEQTLSKIMPAEDIPKHVSDVQATLAEASSKRDTFAELAAIFGKPMRLILIIALAIGIAQQTSGINAVLFYAQTIFKQLGMGQDAAFVQAIWVGLTSVIFTVVGLVLVDKVGRRPLIIWGMVCIIASLSLCAYAFHNARYTLSDEATASFAVELKDTEGVDIEKLNAMAGTEYGSDIQFRSALLEAIGEKATGDKFGSMLESAININSMMVLAGILGFIAAFHFSVGPVMWVLFSEIFPASIRGTAIPFFAVVTSITSWVVQFFFPWQLENMGMTPTFLSYAGTVAIGLVVMFFTLKETKNKSIEEIHDSLIVH